MTRAGEPRPVDDTTVWAPWHRETGFRPGPPRVTVYCFPHAGAAATTYLGWARSDEQPDVEFVPVEFPGRGTRRREPLAQTMDEIVTGFLACLPARPQGERFALFGHSMGAHVAYEVARRAAKASWPSPLLLAVSGARPPGAPEAMRLHDLPDDKLLAAVAWLGGIPSQVLADRDMVRAVLPVLRADLALFSAHVERAVAEPLPCPITAFGGSGDVLAHPSWIESWNRLTSAGFRSRILPGDHFFVHPHRSEVMAAIAAHPSIALGAPG